MEGPGRDVVLSALKGNLRGTRLRPSTLREQISPRLRSIWKDRLLVLSFFLVTEHYLNSNPLFLFLAVYSKAA
jgi:hypothetical protein